MDRVARQGLRRRNRQRAWLLAGVGLGVAIVALLALQAWREHEHAQATQAFVATTNAALHDTLALEATIAAMETHHRGYLLTGDAAFVTQREAAWQRAQGWMGVVEHAFADAPTQAAHVAAARRTIERRHALMQQTTQRAANDGIVAARTGFLSRGANAYEDARADLEAVRTDAELQLADRMSRARKGADGFARLLIFGTGAALLLVVVMTASLAKLLRRNDHIRLALERDILERRAAEAEVRELNQKLVDNNRELEAFSYTISHDLRAPLRHIDGYAKMLREDAEPVLDDTMRRYLDVISDGARRMGVLIDDLLAFARLGRRPVERAHVDMNALARQALLDAGGAHTQAQVHIDDLPDAQADPALLRQAWVNLLSNALKYSAPRGGDARIDVAGHTDGEHVRYTVRDNGVGFDMRYADKLFGVFQRLHTHDEFEGTGVGLAIVQRIVARHGGRVSAESTPGEGAAFTIELPAHVEGASA